MRNCRINVCVIVELLLQMYCEDKSAEAGSTTGTPCCTCTTLHTHTNACKHHRMHTHPSTTHCSPCTHIFDHPVLELCYHPLRLRPVKHPPQLRLWRPNTRLPGLASRLQATAAAPKFGRRADGWRRPTADMSERAHRHGSPLRPDQRRSGLSAPRVPAKLRRTRGVPPAGPGLYGRGADLASDLSQRCVHVWHEHHHQPQHRQPRHDQYTTYQRQIVQR